MGHPEYYDYKVVERDDGKWEVVDPAGCVLQVFDNPLDAGHWARQQIIIENERKTRH